MEIEIGVLLLVAPYDRPGPLQYRRQEKPGSSLGGPWRAVVSVSPVFTIYTAPRGLSIQPGSLSQNWWA